MWKDNRWFELQYFWKYTNISIYIFNLGNSISMWFMMTLGNQSLIKINQSITEVKHEWWLLQKK